jgi:hypothetical protein
MINLLPDNYKKLARKELLRRFLAVFGLFFSVLVFVQLVLFVVVFFVVNFTAEDLKRQKDVAAGLAAKENLTGIESEVAELNNLLEFYRKRQPLDGSFYNDISQILSKSSSISINSFMFEGERCAGCTARITVSGHASSREELVFFVEELRNSGHFEQVKSPPSNLLAEENVDFSVTVELMQ